MLESIICPDGFAAKVHSAHALRAACRFAKQNVRSVPFGITIRI